MLIIYPQLTKVGVAMLYEPCPSRQWLSAKKKNGQNVEYVLPKKMALNMLIE